MNGVYNTTSLFGNSHQDNLVFTPDEAIDLLAKENGWSILTVGQTVILYIDKYQVMHPAVFVNGSLMVVEQTRQARK